MLRYCLMILVGTNAALRGADASEALATIQQYCTQCHNDAAAVAGLSLERLTSQPSVGDSFQKWEKVAAELEHSRMPPEGMPRPSDGERLRTVNWIRAELRDYAERHAGDPGRVTVRRLTTGEYAYTLQDLTGYTLADMGIDPSFASDSAGGEGFTNFGDAQFMSDSDLERYLGAAKIVAEHAVIGSGPLEFFEDPGKTGFELSAIKRIQEIYQRYGFKAVSAEGGRPYGMDLYAKAFYAAWRYRHRKALGEPEATLHGMAGREGLTHEFVDHIWEVLHRPSPAYPANEVIARWNALPAPGAADEETVRAECDSIRQFVTEWPRWLFAAGAEAEGGRGDERAFVLNEDSLEVERAHELRFFVRPRRQRNQEAEKTTRVHLAIVSANPDSKDEPVVVFRGGVVRFRGEDPEEKPLEIPLAEALTEESKAKLAFGKLPSGGAIDATEFAMEGDAALHFDVVMPEGKRGLALQVQAELLRGEHNDAVARLTISDQEYKFLTGRAPTAALLAHTDTQAYEAWRQGVLYFAENMPQNSQGEPTPADKDPIPEPYDNTYNQRERDIYHLTVKYYRTDDFLVEKMLDSATRERLDHAWNDLYASFEFHDMFFDFVVQKFGLDFGGKEIEELAQEEIEAAPEEPRKYIRALREEYDAVQAAQRAAQPGHVGDAIAFASKAWRRPLSSAEEDQLRSFYTRATESGELGHHRAIRALLTRILVSPAFLYRVEHTAETSETRPLTDWEMASRLSYFLWSSMPDDELRQAAAAGKLQDENELRRQARRMLADPKARRLSTEFFGQWLGFYRFDQYRGVDASRFPEFTEEVRAAMYDEAVSFFEHVIREDRPVREILSADYTFLNQALAKHYGVEKEISSTERAELVEGAGEFQRGGVLRLGAVLTVTSAPLRTSPVKRGDWILRRIVGTPTPPPPPDAGSLPSDDKAFGELSLREQLEAHQRNPMCAACHSRIDPLGFPLEHYDAVGRWRTEYQDGQPIHDSGTLFDETEIAGIDGLLDYLKKQEQQVLRTMTSKLLGYALGRTVLASDLPLIDGLARSGGDVTFAAMASEIVSSKQFRYRRGRGEGAPGGPPDQTAQARPDLAANKPEREGER